MCQGGGRVVRKLRFITEEKVERVGGDAVCGTVGVASSELNRFSLFSFLKKYIYVNSLLAWCSP